MSPAAHALYLLVFAAMADAQEMDHSKMDHSKMDHSKMDHSKMDHSQHKPAEAASAPDLPPVTEADIAEAFPDLQTEHAHTPTHFGMLLFDRLEWTDADEGSALAWEVQGWYGSDINRVWLRSEGQWQSGGVDGTAADAELLYGRAVTAWSDVVVGVRHHFGPGPSQDFLAFGVMALAPYKYEVAATAYANADQAGLRLELEYETLFSNRWILQSRLEADAWREDDPARGLGSGLSSVEAGLRLRYEYKRQFAPYAGIVWEGLFGDSAANAGLAGESRNGWHAVLGVRIWF